MEADSKKRKAADLDDTLEPPRILKLQVSLASGRFVDISLPLNATVADLKTAAQKSLAQNFLRLAGPAGRLLDTAESLQAFALQDGDGFSAVVQQPKVAATSKAFALWCACRTPIEQQPGGNWAPHGVLALNQRRSYAQWNNKGTSWSSLRKVTCAPLTLTVPDLQRYEIEEKCEAVPPQGTCQVTCANGYFADPSSLVPGSQEPPTESTPAIRAWAMFNVLQCQPSWPHVTHHDEIAIPLREFWTSFRSCFATWRIGEAMNPGPGSGKMIRIAINNPTSIVSKVDTYREIMSKHRVNVFSCSETSATPNAQQVFRKSTRAMLPFQSWSPPVEELVVRQSGAPSLRGKSGGVAILSNLPARSAVDTITSTWQQTTRIAHAIITLNQVHFQLVTVYCVPICYPGAAQFNSDLIHAALDSLVQLPIPGLLMGDFNGNPLNWECGSRLKQLGFLGLPSKYQSLYGQDMPPTCRDATVIDSGFACLRSQMWIKAIEVVDEPYFDTHKLVLVDMSIPTEDDKLTRFQLPRSFVEFDVDPDLWTAAFQKAHDHKKPERLEDWGKLLEHSLDTALRQQHHDDEFAQRGLPLRYRGRCQVPSLEQVTRTTLTVWARPGDYQPCCEVHTYQTRQKVKQCRRLESLKRLLTKQQLTERQTKVAHQEWMAILGCRAFDDDFLLWCSYWLPVSLVKRGLPPLALIDDMYQLVRSHTDAALQWDKQTWLRKLEFDRKLDRRNQGSSKAFARLKNAQDQPLQVMQNHAEDLAIVHLREDDSLLLYLGNPTQFALDQPLLVDGQPGVILHRDCHSITVMPQVSDHEWPLEATVTQNIHTTDTADIMSQLEQFWQRYWQVEQPDTDDQTTLNQVLQLLPAAVIPDDLPFYDDSQWLQAVRDLKAKSARGLDAISAMELKLVPSQAVLSLRDVIRDDPQCFERGLMVAKTHPLPKHAGVVTSQQVRPITILPQTYRLWSRVAANLLLQVLSLQLPPSITGFLAGRSAHDASYALQHKLETCHAQGNHCSGISIDLHKCFNTIKRSVAFSIFTAIGGPPDIANRWQGALKSMTRTWSVHMCASPLRPTNCGLPEGDALSVLGMICVALGWIKWIEAATALATLLAYADNWGWLTQDPRVHSLVIQRTCSFASMVGMSVDWAKSWAWGTNSRHVNELKRTLTTFPDLCQVPLVTHATELGSHHTYLGPPKLGKVKERIQTAIDRLLVLQKMPHALDTKIHLIRAGIYPVAFYGVELMPLGVAYTNQLRTAVCDALFGHSQSRNSFVALHVTPDLMDPELHVIFLALRAARRYMLRASPADVQAFLWQVSRHDGTSQKCKGPAGSLSHYLARLDWKLTKEGVLIFDAFCQLPLIDLGTQRLSQLLLRAWGEHMLLTHSDRKAWRGLPPIDALETRRVFTRFPVHQQKALICEVSASFQTRKQQSYWDPSVTPDCLHCAGEDTRTHRIFECDATADVRVDHQGILQLLRDQESDLHELPVIHVQPSQDFFHVLCHQFVEPPLLPAVTDALNQLQQEGRTLTFYTDGSCQFPEWIGASHATFAVIWDTTSTPEERIAFAQQYDSGHDCPGFSTLITARLQGFQDIHRAEIAALLYLWERFTHTEVVTDSQVAHSLANKCALLRVPLELAAHMAPDLATRLWRAFHNGRHTVRKIKAHQTISGCTDWLLKYDRMGNQRANDVANQAAKELYPQLHEEAVKLVDVLRPATDELYQFYGYFLKLRQARSQLRKQHNRHAAHAPRQTNELSIAQKLQQYQVGHAWIMPTPRIDYGPATAWGPTWAALFVEWASLLVWPQPDAQGDHVDLGVTWIELSLSFMYHSQMWLPLRRKDAQGVESLVIFQSKADLVAHQVRLAEFADTLNVFYTQMQSLRDTPFFPKLQRQLVRSLFAQGATIFSSGWPKRPVYPGQHHVLEVMESYLRVNKGTSWVDIPEVDIQSSPERICKVKSEIRGSWPDRCRGASEKTRQVREFQKCPVGPLKFH
eukprot:Skav230466  [mRNA]  locus=scaffold186:317909:336027:+ [translate_table: standard]